jgi:hypothetical protein
VFLRFVLFVPLLVAVMCSKFTLGDRVAVFLSVAAIESDLEYHWSPAIHDTKFDLECVVD